MRYRKSMASAIERIPANLRGIGLMVLSGLFYSLMTAIVRWLASDIHPVEQVFFRMLFGLVAVLPFFVRGGLSGMATTRLAHYGLRAGFQAGAMGCFYLGLSLIPLAAAMTLSMTNALFVTVLAILLLGERSVAGRWFAVLLGFAGAVVVLRPDLGGFTFGALFVILSAAIYAGLQVHAKVLTRTEPIPHVIAWTLIMGVPLSLLAALPVWTWPSGSELLWLLMIGLLGTAGNASMTRSFKIGEMNAVAPVWYVRLIFAALLGFTVFGEVPTGSTWVGAAMIALAGIYLSRLEARLSRAAAGSGQESAP